MLLPAMRAEIQEYARACERLFFAFNTSSSFTEEEVELVKYYASEMIKAIGDPARRTLTASPTETASHNGDGTV